ncbi:SAF domain-containing protein [Paenibacillus alginolyticus]|uniref:SAF domain-containing protein n=1 Tax=Paenibacillus alginolyticus TaxID=59839 RepID=UPI000401A5DB|nr:SAF domain-containing protein [Paenibacillus alginolyticus]MCY9665860.1 SAF domain-containing protein [Paenibacillus alginolyticus]
MKNWFIKLPQSVRLLIVVVTYAAIFIGHVAGVNYYVKNYSEKVDSKEVVVTTKEIPLHTVIRTEDLTIKRVRLSDLVGGAIVDPDTIVGKETQAPMGKNEQFNADKINTVVKKEGEMIIEIPTEWVMSFPKSLRRLDKVSLLPVADTTKNARVDFTATANQQSNSVQGSASVTAGGMKDDPNAPILAEARELLKGLTVAYFKDNTANEITDALPANSNAVKDSAPRINSSNLGARLELAVTPEQWAMIYKLTQNTYKFVISYQ